MTTGTKILIGTVAALGIAALFAFSKKTRTTAKKVVGRIADIGDSMTSTPDAMDLQKGSGDVQHILQLQQLLNELHDAVKYINSKCGTPWLTYPGKMPGVSGVFDDATEKAMQFYLGRATIDLEYLNAIREKIAKYEAGNKCKYPLSY